MDEWGPTRHGITISQCVKCRYWQKKGVCEAFPAGVPVAVLSNEHDHTRPYADEKILFAERE